MPRVKDSREKVAQRKCERKHVILAGSESRDFSNPGGRGLKLTVQASVVDRAGHERGSPDRPGHFGDGLQNHAGPQTMRREGNARGAAEMGIEKRSDQLAARVVGDAGLFGIIETMGPDGVAGPQHTDKADSGGS